MNRLLTTSLALTLVASGAPAFAQSDTITLGAAVQLTGANANTGRYYRDAYQFTIDKINEKGGVQLGGKTYKLTLKLYDSQSNEDLGMRQYVQLITQDKVNFLLGPFSSGDAMKDTSMAEKYEMVMVQGGGAAREIFTRNYKFVFGTLPPADNYFASTIDMIQKLEPKAKTVALVAADDSFDVSVAKGTREILKKTGLELVADQQYRENNADFSSILTLVKSKNPDAILWTGHPQEGINFVRQQKSLDVNPKILTSMTVGVPTADFRTALGPDADYVYGMTPWLPGALLKDKWFGDAAEFAKSYQDKFGYAPDYHAASAAADVETFAYAIPAAGSLDQPKVRDAIAKIEFDSLYAHVKFDEVGQVVIPQTVIQIQDGKVVAVYSDKVLNKPVYPVAPWGKR
jgi:branched-chain amino acid transport system substrate-binding protein